MPQHPGPHPDRHGVLPRWLRLARPLAGGLPPIRVRPLPATSARGHPHHRATRLKPTRPPRRGTHRRGSGNTAPGSRSPPLIVTRHSFCTRSRHSRCTCRGELRGYGDGLIVALTRPQVGVSERADGSRKECCRAASAPRRRRRLRCGSACHRSSCSLWGTGPATSSRRWRRLMITGAPVIHRWSASGVTGRPHGE